MSRLLTFQVRQQRATLRVDVPRLFSLAEHLHSCARVEAGPCDSSAEADLAWKHDDEGGQRYLIELLGRDWEAGLDPDEVFFQSENLITQIFCERHADKLQLHAGAVVAPEGKGWLLAGDSGSGKTSLTLALMLEGWSWLSDEVILIEEPASGEMAGVPRNFNIKEVSFAHFPETRARPDGLELASPKRGCLVRFIDPGTLVPGKFAPKASLGAVLFPSFTPSLSVPVLRPCHGVELSAKLISSISQSPAWAVEWVVATAAKVPAWEFRYGEPRAAARFLSASPFAGADRRP